MIKVSIICCLAILLLMILLITLPNDYKEIEDKEQMEFINGINSNRC